MTTRYFSIEEANSLLTEIEPLMARLLERRAKVVRLRKEIADILEDGTSDVGGAVPSELVQDFFVIERLVRKIRSYGCIIKDVNTGLIDFLSERDGREVFLCWRFGEPRIEFYHELHSGFLGREHV
jgi:hypothetical protein